MEHTLCIGDIVCLYSAESNGYVFAFQSSAVHNEVAVGARQDKINPDFKDQQVFAFEICVANRYKLNKKYRKLNAKLEKDEANPNLSSRVHQAQKAANAENEDNKQQQKIHQGKNLLYGQVIQLRHLFTNKYIHVSTSTSIAESNNMAVELQAYNAKHAQFKIMPMYKIKAGGVVVHADDQIVLESVKCTGQYLHVSEKRLRKISIYDKSYELNLSVHQSGFIVCKKYKPAPDDDKKVKAGDAIRFYHNEIGAYLAAEGLFTNELTDDVHLRMRPVDQSKPKTMFPSSSSITYWEIELQQGPVRGGVLKWEQHCKLIHLCTRRYLSVDQSGKVTLISDQLDPRAVFCLHPVIRGEKFINKGKGNKLEESDDIHMESYCLIQHVVTKQWLHASTEKYKPSQESMSQGSKSLSSLKWSSAELKMINVTENKQQGSTFTVQHVEKELVDAFHFTAGMVPFLQKLVLTNKKENKKLDAVMAYKASMALKEIKNFMVKDGEPLKSRQKLMRNLKIVDLMVNLLKIPVKGPDQEYLWKTFVDVYDALSTCLLGHSQKNKLCIARYIDTFLKQFVIKELKIGQNAVHMVTEIIRDNRKIVDRITHDHIDQFVDLLHTEKHHCYLDLLMVLCVCDGVSITENQKYITDVWLTKGSKGSVFFTQFGESIGYETGVVYVSTDGRNWDELKDFAEENKDKDEYVFLEHQLELFGFLCHGHNKESVEAITQQLNYLSWEGAFVCLKNEELPDLLRARYCDLIIKMFVDISENHSQDGRVQLSYIYKDLDKEENQPDISNLSETYIQLRDWSFEFLEKNCSMVASNIGKNMLTKQVLRLFHYLVSFGFYSKLSDIEKLVEPLMKMLDSREDMTSPNSKGIEARDGVQVMPALTGIEAQESVQNSQTKERFQKSPQIEAVVDARLQAMKVLDLVFDVVFKKRLQKFLSMFREVYDKAKNPYQGVPGLGCLMEEPFDLNINRDVASTALRQLDEIFEGTSLLKPSVVEIFLDLSKYDYDDMVRKSMHHLNRYYSAYSGLFKKALQSQVLVSDASVKVFKSINKRLRVLRRLSTLKLADAEARKLCDILDDFIHMCHLQGDEGEPHRINQNILYNNGVLEDTLTILSQEIDNQHAGLQHVFQKTFTLLKMMACGNVTVQGHLFNHLDLLLSKAAAVQEMAETLTEVFIGNHSACLKIMQHQVHKIMLLVAEHKSAAPQFLDLLHAVVKCDKLDVPLKRNQDLVMTYFVQFRADVAYVIENDENDREAILTSSQTPDSIYFISLVNLLAACAEGENKFTESVCQTVFKISELLKILNNPNISDNWKRPFLRFFLWVYLNTTSESNESWAFDIPHDNAIWDFLNSLNGTLQTVTEYARNNGDDVKQLLKRPPGKSDQSTDHPDTVRGSLHYLFDAVMPFLKVFCQTYYQHDGAKFPKEPGYMNALAHSFKTFLEVIRPLISTESQMKMLTNCLHTLVSSITLSAEEKKAFQDLIENKVQCQDVCSESRKKYEDSYKEEEEVNSKLKVFVLNMKTAFGGVNDVWTQIGFRSKEPYSKIGSDEELPLGVEFQEHLKCFMNPDEKDFSDKYQMAKRLVLQLKLSMTFTRLNEKEQQEEVELNIKCFQLLRGLIHNEIAKLPPDFRSDVKASSRQLKVIKNVQNALNSFDTIQSVLKHMSSPHDKICQELLAFLAALLFNGNEEVQKSVLDYFTGCREDTFMFAMKNRMSLSVIATTGRCVLHALHRANVEAQMTTREVSGAPDQQTRQNSHLPPRHRTSSGSDLHVQTGNSLRLLSTNRVNPMSEVDIGLQVMGQSNRETHTISSGLDLKDDGYIDLALKVLRLMCNQQYSGLQDYLREQPDSINSVNLVSDTTHFLSILYSIVNDKSVELITQLFDTLVRMTSGNLINQALVFENKICDYITHILRVGTYKDCSTRDIYSLKRSIGTLLKSLTEENPKVKEGDASAELPKELMECIDTDILVTVMVEAYSDLKRKEKDFKENQNLVSEVGFLYFHIIKRKMDLKKDLTLKALIKKDKDKVVWDYFEENTMSVEVLKEDVLQKLYFRVKKKNMLRKEIKEKFKYEVDRSSPSNKLKDFMDWSRDIMADIKYRKRIHANLMKWLLVKMWLPMNYMVMTVTMAITLFILITYQAGSVGTPMFLPSYRYPDVYSVIFGLGGLHNFLSVCIFLTFIISNHPTFTPSGELPQLFLVPINFIVNMAIFVWNIRSRLTGSERKPLSPWYKKKPKSHLEVKAYGFKTIYYLIFLACSVAGTATYGYFFAFHLLHLCEMNQRLKRVIKAVTTNGRSLLMVVILGLAFFYIYALILFVSYRGWIWKESDGRHCTTVYQCFVSIIHHGFVGGPYTTFDQYMTNMTSSFDTVVSIAVFDVSFFIIITIIGLYLILGVIIDTFSQLRDSKWEIDKDMQNTCFICNRKSQDFERHRGGFERHVKMEHNQWAYLFFFIHLDETDDYSALEFRIYKQLLENNLDFFPLKRSLSLENEVDIKEQRSWKDKSGE